MKRHLVALLSVWLVSLLCGVAAGQEQPTIVPASNSPDTDEVGKQPYCVDVRHEAREPQVDFQDLTGWKVALYGKATGKLVRTREARLWREFTAKLVDFSADAPDDRAEILPPSPIPLPDNFNAVNLWACTDGWYINRRLVGKPPITARISVRIVDASGERHEIFLDGIEFKDWFLLHRPFVQKGFGAPNYKSTGGDGNAMIEQPAQFEAIIVRGPTAGSKIGVFFDSLVFYREELKPLDVPPQPEPFFPTTPDTILPTCSGGFLNRARRQGDCILLDCVQDDYRITYAYEPRDGTLGDIRATVDDEFTFQPMYQGGLCIASRDGPLKPDSPEIERKLLSLHFDGQRAEAKWRWTVGDDAYQFRYLLRIKQKSLIIEVEAPGGGFCSLDLGVSKDTPHPRIFAIPFFTIRPRGPYCLICGDLFVTALFDWYNSDASVLRSTGYILSPTSARYNHCAEYLPKTDGTRNDLRERIFLTVSQDFHEVLPNIPNPKNPYAEIARDYLWRDMGRENIELLKTYKELGIDKYMAEHNGAIWKDGADFTRRIYYADGGINKGDEEFIRYADEVRKMGFLFGIHTNYRDFPPGVYRTWDEDLVVRTSNGDWQRSWGRCYALKPTFALAMEKRFSNGIHSRFGTNTGYLDVHTAIEPWSTTDYDVRVPGAGKFKTTFAAYAALMRNECKIAQGPVISEGRAQAFSAGFPAGNYGQLGVKNAYKVPMVYDFDLLKIHPLEADIGVGMPYMFYPMTERFWREDKSVHNPYFDRFLAATLAAGHIGYLAHEWGQYAGAMKSYYMLKGVQQRYCLVDVEKIRFNRAGELVSTSEAILSNCHRDNQLYVRYVNGLEIYANNNFDGKHWDVTVADQGYDIPPTGFVAFKPDDVLVYSSLVRGRRVEYSRCDEYVYADSRGGFAHLNALALDGAAALRKDAERNLWVIPALAAKEVTVYPEKLGLAWEGEEVRWTSFLPGGEKLSEGACRHSRGGFTVFPVEEARRYCLSAAPTPKPDISLELACDSRELVPSESYDLRVVTRNNTKDTARGLGLRIADEQGKPFAMRTDLGEVREGGSVEHTCTIAVPADLKPDARLWLKGEVLSGEKVLATAWIDFAVAAPFEMQLMPLHARDVPCNEAVQTTLVARSNIPQQTAFEVSLTGAEEFKLEPSQVSVNLQACGEARVPIRITAPAKSVEREVEITGSGAPHAVSTKATILAKPSDSIVLDLHDVRYYSWGLAYRGEEERRMDASSDKSGSRFLREGETSCGGTWKKAFAAPPPFIEECGYTYGEFVITLPDAPAVLSFYTGIHDPCRTEDGVLFIVEVADESGRRRRVFQDIQKDNAWQHHEVDLSDYAGQWVTVRFITDSGPADNSASDAARWGELMVMTKRPGMDIEIASP